MLRKVVSLILGLECNERKVTGGGARRRETASRINDVVKAESLVMFTAAAIVNIV